MPARLGNKDNSGPWPTKKHIGWSVATAGRVELEYEFTARDKEYLPSMVLPAGFRFLLKDIDSDGHAWLYRDDYGVIRLPLELLVAWDR